MKRDIAIIGISCRFPDASTLEGLYDNMRMGRDSLKEISLSRLKGTTLPESGSYRVCGYLEDIDKFDYSFFNISPGEAQTMDPHQRLLLEVVYETFENAGYNIGEFSGSNTSVYVSDSNLEYYHHADDFVPTLKTGNVKAFLGSRISRQFNFTGNVSMIDTSCSSSLVAVHLACNELILGDSDYGLVCGVNLDLFPYKESEGSLDLDSPDGKSRPFTTEANGMSFGEAVISILLKPLEKAQRSGDHIHGVIKGSAINNNGDRSASLTAPDSVTQAEVIKRAWIKAGVIPEDIGYIEAHGSGTQLGDSIEVGGLDSAISSFTSKKNLCPISTIKSNLGHCRGAAGLAGMVRAILSIQHKELFPTVHFSQGSSLIDFDNSSVYVTETLKPWEVETGKRRYAGVSSIGLSGVNCHLVLAEPPEMPETEEVSRKELVTISSKTPSGLRRNKEELGEYLKRHVNSLQDISYTLGVGRQHHKHRYSFICKDVSDLLEDIISGDEQTDPVSVSGRGMDRLIMVFMDRVDVTLQDIGQYVVFYEAFNSAYCNCERNYKGDTGSAIFTGFAFQYSLYKLLEVSGIMIKDVLGLGIGRLLAGVISGEYSLSEGLERLLSYEEEPLEDLGLRIGSMIGRETSKDQVGFVLAGADPIVLSMFEAHDHGRNYYTYRLGSGFTDDMLLRFMQWCYDRGYHLDWDLFYKDRGGRRVALPVYQFEKTRCWIRESPKVNLSINGSDSSSVRGVLLRGGGNEILHRIAEIWSEVLEIKEFSLGDDFFELGGNSLKATTVIHQLNSDFGILLDFEDIFEYPTLQGLGDYISCQYSTTDRVKSYWQDVLKLSDIGIDDNFFELGGHSLIANQIINRLIGEYNIVLSFEDFFRYPTVRSLSAYVESLQLAEDGGVEAIPVIESQDYYELSVFQKRLWLLSQFREASVAYNQAEVFEISGFLDRAAFESSFRDLVSRHDSLRTIFTVLSGVPKQRVQPVDSLGFTILYIDLRGVSSQEEKVAGMISEESHTPFDLAGGPLVRCKLLQTGEKSYIFLFTTHHIISDGWSMGVMVREISSLYTSYKEGSEGSLPLLRTQYKDYTGWLNKRFAGDTLSSLRAYWLTVFSGPLPLLSLPLDYKRPLVKTYEGRRVSFELDRNTARMLNKKSQAQGVSLFMILLGTIKVLLYRYTGQEDIILGVPVAGRGHKDLEDQIGFYVNTLAIRTRFSGEDSFTALLEKVKEATLGAYRHQIYPFDWLIQDLNLDRDLSRSPLFDVAVTFNNTEINNIEHVTMPGLTVKEYDTEVSNSKFDLLINIKEFNDKLFFDLDYNTDLFKESSITLFFAHYVNLVHSIIKNSDISLSELEYLSTKEKNALLRDFNRTEKDYPKNKTIHELFEVQCLKTPNALAIITGNRSLTYKQLNERANQLAHNLRDNYNVVPDELICLMLEERSTILISCILGILKAGAAYLPIDSRLPISRKKLLLEDSGAKILITQQSILFKNKDIKKIKTLEKVLVTEKSNIYSDNASNPTSINTSKDLCYLIYTSGTTGKPKGVMVEHQGVVNYATWAANQYVKEEKNNFAFFTSISFDLTITSIFTPLITGNAIVVYADYNQAFLLEKILDDNKAAVIKLTPSHLKLIRDKKIKFSNVKRFIVGGEEFETSLAKEISDNFDDNIEIFNEYGPTEAVVGCMIYKFSPTTDNNISIPIGRPINNVQIYLLDEYYHPVPQGVIGDLYIAGDGLARGYLNDNHLTREKFVANPFVKGGKMYKTGDLGRFLPDGNIELTGRKDNQVKIRGHRIELGEIESVIMSHESIAECVVDIIEDSKKVSYQNYESQSCTQCGLSSDYPDITFDSDGLCDKCSSFNFYKNKAQVYFKSIGLLYEIFENAKASKTSEYDCLMLLSGGKDSTFVLYQLVREMKLNVLAFSFDNGFISEEAKANIRRVTDELRVKLMWGSTSHMNEIFVDSLKRYSNVCNGCYKTIYTLAFQVAYEKKIKFIVTGLSRGQLFETRLNELYDSQIFDPDEIDKIVLDARKIYHTVDDAVSKHLSVGIFKDDKIFEKVELIDYYRYSDVKLEEMYAYLDKHAPWVRPADTGRSTNCLINDLGIYIHKKEQGFHNYALPYSWDVRMGHKTREEAVDELDDEIDVKKVKAMLNEIGYDEDYKSKEKVEKHLAAYLVSKNPVTVKNLRNYLSKRLPDYMIPLEFLSIDDIPLTVNGKVDRIGLRKLGGKKIKVGSEYVGARNDIEERLVNIWQKILPGNRIGVLDNFFDLGGHSISALRMVVQVLKDLGVEINIRDVFSVPTIGGLSTLISNLKPSEYVSIGIMEDQEYYGMSHGQRRLWVIEQFGEDHIAYNMPAVYQMEGYLDEASLTKSFASLIERHEILRTSFITVDGVPRQKVNSYEESGFAIERIDIQDFEDKLERLDSIINAEISSPFDLGAGSMLRVKLIKVERSSYILVSHMHHIVSDAWSVDVLINDIVSYYNGYLFDKSYSLPSLEIQYKDYSRWQSKQLFGAGLNSDKTYWLDQLSGLLPVLSLSTDYVRPQVKTFKGAAVPFRLSKALVSGLEGLGQVHGSSLFMVLMASLKALLYRYTGQGDIIIGTPVAGRDHLDLEGQIGFYINTLALRTGFSGSDTFEDLLQKVKEVTLDGYEHQGYPFDQLVEELDLERDSSHSAVFDIMLVFQNADIGERGLESMDGLQVRSYPIKTQVSKFDITLNLWESEDGGLSGSVQYNTDLYKSGTIERFIGHYNNLLSSVLLDSRVVIGKINYIGEAERDSLLYGFNTTRCLYPMEKTLPCLFEAQVITHPDALAVVYEGISLTYKELNARSNQLASYLRTSLKLGKGDYVGVMLDRSEWMVISILGILKAGASYVPIDMAYPWSRVFYLLEETEVKVLLTDQEARDEETTRGIIRISPFRSWAEIGTYPSSDLQLGVDSGSVAYIMYTSGTTGRPKGVMVSHKNILRLVKSPNYVSLKAGTRLLQTGALSFDATTFEIWGILLNGGELHLLPHAKLMDVPSLKKKISETGIDIMWITSSWFNQLVDSDVSLFSDLGQIIVGGDKLSVSHIKKLRSSEKSLGIINAYGPTENTTFSTYYPIGMVEADDSIPIGKPISNSTVYILDSDRQLVPIGVDGEIYVGGDGVALGYWKRDELTADCFIKSPYAEGGLLYRTGDLGCWLPDGNVAFKGRIDNQVKVRGYRVEPTEVAQILKEHSHVSDSMVIAHKDPSGDTQLLAYIVSDGTLDSAHMNSYLMDHLPSYMLPSFYIFLTEFPLTVNGKVDRSSLPVPGSYSLTEGTTYVAPVTVLDQKLCSLWEEVLQRSPIGIRDSFFDHGGHSLKALQIISRINKAFGSALSIKDIFMHPSVEGLSTQLKAVGGEASYEAIAGIEEQFYYDVSSSQRRLWILSLFTGNETAYNITDSYVFEGILDPEALASSFESLLARHEILRTTFIDVGGDPKQRVHAIGKRCLDYDYIDMKGSGSDAVRLKIESLSGMGFDLQEGPLLRLRLLQLEECKHIFVLSMHHIISDAWSMGVLVREVITLYNAYKQGDCNPLSALRLQYKDYSVWENTRLRSGGLAAQKQYWLSELSGSLPVLEIPGENVRPSVKTYKGNTLGFVLDPHVTAAIINLSQIEQTSIFIILLTTVKMLLHRYSQQDDIIVGTTVAGRDHIALEDQIGFYVNTLALRTRYSEGESFISLLGKVKATMLEVYSHQQYPFDRLVEDLQLSRDMSRSALFDVLVEMLNTESGVASGEQLEGLEVRRYDIDQTISKYDISFRFSESMEGIHVSIEYNSDLYTEERIGYMAEHYRLLVSGVLEDVGVRIKSFPLLSLGELQMLTGYNDSYIGYDTDETLLELFKRQVLRNPSGIALSYKDRMLSYEQLDDQSGQLSAYLISQYDIGREDIVGIMLSKSEQMVVSLLGVMKCGGSFLAIDSSYPSGRISYMLSDSSVKLLITESDYLYSVGSYYQGSLLSLDIELPLILEEEQSGEVDQPWDSLAYVMYTSGSTGDPKGVGIEVGNLTNYIRWANGYYFGDEGGYPFALFTSLSFDLTLTSLFSTLLRGDIVHIYEDSVSTGDVLRDIFSNPGLIRAVKLTPSHIKVLDRLGLSQTHISEVIVGGEELTVDQVRVLRELNPEVNIYNEYGPTEATIGCTVKKIDAEDALISIGSPIGNTQIYILSDEKALQPLGVSGEIYVGGSGVGRGYLNRVGLTNLCFIEDKINGSGRLYKTGDIGRWQLNGEIVYMGRKDEQVKIHGYRIETGEVESVLLQHPLVSSAIVVSKELQGEKTLVAYIVSAEELSGQQMKTWLGSYLPAYMLPAYYVQIAAVPLTGSGKTAKGLLPDPLVGVQGSGVAYLGARTRLESRLVEIWKGVLGLERVGIRDNFFDLGGDSLKLVSLNQQICEQFQSNITITDLFKYTTVEMIGSYLEGEKRTTFEQGIEV